MKGVSLLNDWDCQGVHTVFSIQFPGTLKEEEILCELSLRHGLIYMFIEIQIWHYCHCLWYPIFIPCKHGFLFLLNLGEWWLNFNIAVILSNSGRRGVQKSFWLTYPVLGKIPTYGDTCVKEIAEDWTEQFWQEVMCHLLSLLWSECVAGGGVFPCSWKPH